MGNKIIFFYIINNWRMSQASVNVKEILKDKKKLRFVAESAFK
jgi:hypothetical protein